MEDQEVTRWALRLHRSGRPWDVLPDEVDWMSTAVGDPVVFKAVQFGSSGWYARGPVTIVAAEDLEHPAWTVWPTDVVVTAPTMIGEVGRPLRAGENFALPVTSVMVGGVSRLGTAEGTADV